MGLFPSKLEGSFMSSPYSWKGDLCIDSLQSSLPKVTGIGMKIVYKMYISGPNLSGIFFMMIIFHLDENIQILAKTNPFLIIYRYSNIY